MLPPRYSWSETSFMHMPDAVPPSQNQTTVVSRRMTMSASGCDIFRQLGHLMVRLALNEKGGGSLALLFRFVSTFGD